MIKELRKEFNGTGSQSDFTFKQLFNRDGWAMYSKTSDYATYYEVFRVEIRKGGEAFGVMFEDREHYPTDREFGVNAWCFKDYTKAMNKLHDNLEYKDSVDY